jgi:hypothetical protein
LGSNRLITRDTVVVAAASDALIPLEPATATVAVGGGSHIHRRDVGLRVVLANDVVPVAGLGDIVPTPNQHVERVGRGVLREGAICVASARGGRRSRRGRRRGKGNKTDNDKWDPLYNA